MSILMYILLVLASMLLGGFIGVKVFHYMLIFTSADSLFNYIQAVYRARYRFIYGLEDSEIEKILSKMNDKKEKTKTKK